jgi:hypothetical protein
MYRNASNANTIAEDQEEDNASQKNLKEGPRNLDFGVTDRSQELAGGGSEENQLLEDPDFEVIDPDNEEDDEDEGDKFTQIINDEHLRSIKSRIKRVFKYDPLSKDLVKFAVTEEDENIC